MDQVHIHPGSASAAVEQSLAARGTNIERTPD
jgi:hypothetical protein